jgi:hypothetical protein
MDWGKKFSDKQKLLFVQPATLVTAKPGSGVIIIHNHSKWICKAEHDSGNDGCET